MGDLKTFTNRLVMWFVTLAELVLSLRLVFRLVDADVTNAFVRWVYAMSDTLLAPFRGIFPLESFEQSYVLEFKTLFAMAAYAIIGYLLLAVIHAVPKPRKSGGSWRKWLRDRLG